MDEISNFEKLIKIAGFTKPQNIKINLKKKNTEIFVGLTMSVVWGAAKCAGGERGTRLGWDLSWLLTNSCVTFLSVWTSLGLIFFPSVE